MSCVRVADCRGAAGAELAAALAREGIVVVGGSGGDAPAIDALLAEARDLPALLASVERATPIVIVDGPGDAIDRARLLDAGAADVVAAPADPVELAARLRALVRLRRMPPIECADLRIDRLARAAERAGRPLPLHPREFALLAALASARGRPVERMALLGAVWRRQFDPGTNIVAVTVSRLRAKVDHGFARPLIHTVGSGYMLSETAVAVR